MAFFKFRLPGQTASALAAEAVHTTPAESLEVLRQRARHRLIGSVVLVLEAAAAAAAEAEQSRGKEKRER